MIEISALGLSAPDGSVIGLIGRLPETTTGDYLIEESLAALDAVAKAQAITELLSQRRAGATIVVCTDDERILSLCADEIWWLAADDVIARGAPEEVLGKYRRHVALALRAAGSGHVAAISPSLRDGDGRAVLEKIELLDLADSPVAVWRSGEAATIRVTVRFLADIADPVVGILIRTRIGLNVYGTNTELENMLPGQVLKGEAVEVTYRFACHLCPGDYTVTAASHDRDGVWHDWAEDAVAFAVHDDRYTAGVANLRACVETRRV